MPRLHLAPPSYIQFRLNQFSSRALQYHYQIHISHPVHLQPDSYNGLQECCSRRCAYRPPTTFHQRHHADTKQASGNLGQITLPAFLESDLEVTAIVRSTSTATFPEGIKVIKTEYNLADLTEALKGKDAVISMIPIVSLDQQAVVIDAAIAAGVKRFIPSEYGSDTRVSIRSAK